jgi:hypothetical protein
MTSQLKNAADLSNGVATMKELEIQVRILTAGP